MKINKAIPIEKLMAAIDYYLENESPYHAGVHSAEGCERSAGACA